MRVIHLVCSDGFGGVERYIANLAISLRAHGDEVDVVGGSARLMPAAVIGAGVRWHPGGNVREAWRSLGTLDAADILNTHMSQADVLGVMHGVSPRAQHSAHVSTRHFAAPRGGSRLTRAAFSLMQRRIAAELAISTFVAESIRSPSIVVHSGVASRPLSAERDRVVLVAQRLEAEKDTATALRAWGLSAAAGRGWRMQIAGEGAQLAGLVSLAEQLGVSSSVDFLGFRSDIDALLSRAGCVLAPTPREGLGILVLEAMAHGAPVIASAAGGHLETIGAVESSLIFPVGDAAAAGDLIDALVEDEPRRRAAGAAGWAWQREHFSLDAQTAGTRALYSEVLAR